VIYRTTTNDDLGSFFLESRIPARFVEVEAEGFFFNEYTAQTADFKIILRSYGDLSSESPINLNVLTTITHKRIKNLVASGATFQVAVEQAENELLLSFDISADDYMRFHAYNFESGNNDAAILLAVSSALIAGRSTASLSLLLADIALDFSDNGKIDNPELFSAVKSGASKVNANTVTLNLTNHYKNRGRIVTVPDFENYRLALVGTSENLSIPIFSEQSGIYFNTISVSISKPHESEVRYTLDGSDPTSESLLYTEPILITAPADITLKAVAINNEVVSEVVLSRYIVKEARNGDDYVDLVPGSYVQYAFTGFDGEDPFLCNFFAVMQETNTANQFILSLSCDVLSSAAAYLFPKSASDDLAAGSRGGSISGGPFPAWYYFLFWNLPKTVVSGETYQNQGSNTTFTPTFGSWNLFEDVIVVSFDSTQYSSTSETLTSEMRGMGKAIYAKGIGLVHLEIEHTAGNNVGKTETMTYFNHGIAPQVTITGKLLKAGTDALGYTISPYLAVNELPNSAYHSLGIDGNFTLQQYSAPNSYFRLFVFNSTNTSINKRFNVKIPPEASASLNLDLGIIDYDSLPSAIYP
jgi:hypothetical protein